MARGQLFSLILARQHLRLPTPGLGYSQVLIIRAGQVRKLVRKSANPQLRTNEKSCGHADLRTLAV